MKLLDKAKALQKKKIYMMRSSYSKEERELAVAYFKGEVSMSSVRGVLGRPTGVTMYTFLVRAFKQAVENGDTALK